MEQLSLENLPAHFGTTRYEGTRIPDGNHDMSHGANCQRFAYAVLAHFGLNPPPLRSSELWFDRELTVRVADFAPLDLLLFDRKTAPYGAYVAVYAGNGQALHLCKAIGQPVVWALTDFIQRAEYRILLGGKRVLRSTM